MNSDEHLRTRRVQYETAGLDREHLDESPIVQWHRWYSDAVEAGLPEPNAMVVSTVDAEGAADSRVVLARSVDGSGIAFYGNYESAKGRQIDGNDRVAAVFPWLAIHRQVRVRGVVQRLDPHESDEYFASRPRESRLGAWASRQSSVIADRAELERRLAEIDARFPSEVPRPDFWGGWRLVPHTFEFWQGRPSRLHDRFRYSLGEGGTWSIDRLAP